MGCGGGAGSGPERSITAAPIAASSSAAAVGGSHSQSAERPGGLAIGSGIVLRGTGGSGPRSPTGTRVVCGEGPMRMVVWRMTPGSALLSAVSAAAAEGNRSAGS